MFTRLISVKSLFVTSLKSCHQYLYTRSFKSLQHSDSLHDAFTCDVTKQCAEEHVLNLHFRKALPNCPHPPPLLSRDIPVDLSISVVYRTRPTPTRMWSWRVTVAVLSLQAS